MYSASNSPFATICASAIIVAVYGRIGYAVITSTSAYFAACAAATQPLIRTVFLFFSTTVAMGNSAERVQRRIDSDSSPVLNVLRRQLRHPAQLFRLSSVQPLRDRERGVHANDARIEVELRHPFEAAGRALLDTHATSFAIVHQDLVQPVRPIVANDARLGTHQVTVVAGIAGAATEAPVGFFHRLFF